MNYVAPSFEQTSFHCPICNAYSRQYWYTLSYYDRGYYEMENSKIAICEHCKVPSYWVKEKMILPDISNIPLPNKDLPVEIQEDYNEARSILNKSPRGAAALLRLAIQKLCIVLGEEGKNINDDIKKLVEKGLPVQIQKSLDVLRVIGNNAVHPGSIDLKDNYELTVPLFTLLNLITDVMITQPNFVNDLYSKLPENLIKAIDIRDSKSS